MQGSQGCTSTHSRLQSRAGTRQELKSLRRAYAARTVIGGKDSPEAMRLKRLAEHPTEHSLYGMSKRGHNLTRRLRKR
jgi:hypothetical protein